MYVLVIVIVPKPECAEVWKGSAKLQKNLETVRMAAAEKMLRMSENDEEYSAESNNVN